MFSRFCCLLALAAGIVVFMFTPAFAEIINIPDDYEAIQEGIDASSDGDTVLVQPGTYVENINFNGHNIVLGSLFLTTGDTSYIPQTVIDGDSSGTVVIFESEEDSTAIITGFTIQNGYRGRAGGIFCDNYSRPVIYRNIIAGNSGDQGGGIIASYESDPTIFSNVIRDNFALTGGAIYCESYSDPIIDRNVIVNNSARDWGGAIVCDWISNPIITNNTISGNSSGQHNGGGIYCGNYSNPTITGNVISDNSAQKGGGIYCNRNSNPIIDGNDINSNSAFEGGGIACYDNSNPSISNNNIVGNSFYLGSGIYCETNSSPDIFNNYISGNYANWGSGVACLWNSNASLNNNLIIGNFASANGAGIYCVESDPLILNNTLFENIADNRGGGMYCVNSSPLVANTIFWADTASWLEHEIFTIGGSPVFIYCNIEGGWPGEGNIDADPLFRDPDNGDYHLMAIECGDPYDSPCIDAGHPDILDSLLDCAHGLGTLISDMGAYGGNNYGWVGIEDDNDPSLQLPESYLLYQNYPNPFNASTVISYDLPKQAAVAIDIYDILGRNVSRLFEGVQPAGSHSIVWRADNFSSGMYFYNIKVDSYSETKKMILLK